jgi:hypothetical protein
MKVKENDRKKERWEGGRKEGRKGIGLRVKRLGLVLE